MTFIHNIATAVPPYSYHQDYAMTCMKRWVRDPVMRRMVHHVYRQSGIDQRFSALPDFQPGAEAQHFREQADGFLDEPSTGQRNHIYQESFPALARAAVSRVFDQTPWLKPEDVTHVVTVSCTGFCNPGPDLFLVHEFGISPTVERYQLGFMGCYAAFPALRLADQCCRANPNAVVLILCLELCSLHLQIKPTPDALLANALFGDGAGAVLVSQRELPSTRRGYQMNAFATRIIPDSEKDMAWTIGDRGFDMMLSSYVPRILGLHAREVLTDVAETSGSSLEAIQSWAVHPGGKSILHALETQMHWSADDADGALACSYRVLRDYGNMSSATILFVLKAMLDQTPIPDGAAVGALAFGPGLTVEFGLLQMMGAPVVQGLQGRVAIKAGAA